MTKPSTDEQNNNPGSDVVSTKKNEENKLPAVDSDQTMPLVPSVLRFLTVQNTLLLMLGTVMVSMIALFIECFYDSTLEKTKGGLPLVTKEHPLYVMYDLGKFLCLMLLISFIFKPAAPIKKKDQSSEFDASPQPTIEELESESDLPRPPQ